MRKGMAEKKPARNGLLLQTLKAELFFCDAEGPQKALPHQIASFPEPAGSAAPNAIAPVRTHPFRHKSARFSASGRRIQIRDLVSTLTKLPECRPRETQKY